jgi:signal transduction histidine kinase/DNA-binding LacI/PurR family transcriptional regulator
VNPLKEYHLPNLPLNKSKLTIGFLDENPYMEYHNQKMAGVFDAARKYNINIIRLSDYTSNAGHQYDSQFNMILDHIQQYPLDGLIFIGWTRVVYDNFENFIRRLSAIPLLSIGKIFDDIPHVHFPGGKYLREILLHLIQFHHFQRIAYITPIQPDERNGVYIETMKEFGIYDPELFVDIPEQEYSTVNGRAARALTILLDERKARFEAIISLYNVQTADLLDELKKRGFNVPLDISITSYEDGEIGKYSSPALSTVYYPWYDLGFNGCEKMVQLLTNGSIPLSTEVSGQIIYRYSCGCLSNAVQLAGNYPAKGPAGTLETMTTAQKKMIISEMDTAFPYAKLDFAKLLDVFLYDFERRAEPHFLTELAFQLTKFPYGFTNLQIENLISVFRWCLLPFLVHDEQAMLWAGDLFQQAQILVWETVTSIDGQEKVNTKIFYQALQDIGQVLVADFTIVNLMDALAESLSKLRIPGCYLFMCQSMFHLTDDNSEQFFANCDLVFEYSEGARLDTGEKRPVDVKRLFGEFLTAKPLFHAFWAQLLHVGDDFMGFILYEPGPMDEKIYQALSDHISTTLRGFFLLKTLELNYKKLAEQAHREGMADISTEILHNMGNILNSINVSVGLMKDILNSSSLDDLTRANSLLRSHVNNIGNFIQNHPKSSKLWKFYRKIGESYRDLKNYLLYHLNRLDIKVSSINEIITAQQNYAGVLEMTEELVLSSVLEDALKLHADSINNYQIQITRDYRKISKVSGQRIKLFHILVNIINNAIEAMLETPPEERRLKLIIDADSHGKYIRITDNGCGIPAHLLEKIFEYGYTTKKNGKGMSLHNCAEYMAEMGGRILAESNGPGTGATLVVKFK